MTPRYPIGSPAAMRLNATDYGYNPYEYDGDDRTPEERREDEMASDAAELERLLASEKDLEEYEP